MTTRKSLFGALALSLGVSVLFPALRPAQAMQHEGELTENRYALACTCSVRMIGDPKTNLLGFPDKHPRQHVNFTFGYVKSDHIDGQKDELCTAAAASGHIKAAQRQALAVFTFLNEPKNGHYEDIRHVGFAQQKFQWVCGGEVAETLKVSKTYKDEDPKELQKSSQHVNIPHTGGSNLIEVRD
jgi:hypothetical protein